MDSFFFLSSFEYTNKKPIQPRAVPFVGTNTKEMISLTDDNNEFVWSG